MQTSSERNRYREEAWSFSDSDSVWYLSRRLQSAAVCYDVGSERTLKEKSFKTIQTKTRVMGAEMMMVQDIVLMAIDQQLVQ